MEIQEYIVFGLALGSVIYLAFRFYKKRVKKAASNSDCGSDCGCK